MKYALMNGDGGEFWTGGGWVKDRDLAARLTKEQALDKRRWFIDAFPDAHPRYEPELVELPEMEGHFTCPSCGNATPHRH